MAIDDVQVSRRQLFSAAGGLAGVALLSACGTPGSEGGGSGAKSLTTTAFGGDTGDRYAKAVYDPFAKANGVHITQVDLLSADAFARMVAEKNKPVIDLFNFSGGQEAVAKKKGLTADLGDLNGASIPDAFVDPDGQWVANAVIPEGIVYNTDKIKTPPTSYRDFLNPAYQGHVAFPDLTNGYGMDFLVMLARAFGGSEHNIDPGFEALKKIAPDASIFKEAADVQSEFAQNGAWIMPYDSSNAFRAQQAGLPVQFVFPKEGAPASLITYCIAKNSEHVDVARKAVAYAVSPGAQAKIARYLHWLPTNSQTKLSGQLAKDIPVGQSALDKVLMLDRNTINEHQAAWISRFNREVV